MRPISPSPTPQPSTPLLAREARIHACTLSAIAGFVDTCVFVGMFGLFTAHITGNLALIGAELVHHSGHVFAKLLALPVFVLAIVVTVLATDFRRRAGRPSIALVLCAEAILLVMTLAISILSGPLRSPDAPLTILAGMFAVAAMGLQNALMRMELSSLPATTVMTVNVTQAVIDAVTILTRRGDPSADGEMIEQARRRFARMWPSILTFALGAALGAIGYFWMGLASLILPAIVCLGLAWRSR